MKARDFHRLGREGFSLVEVTLALGVAAFCLVVLLGLIPAGVNSDQASLEQTAAAGMAAAVVADLRLTPKTVSGQTTPPTSPRYGLAIVDSSGNATGTIAAPETIYLAEDGSATKAGAAPVLNAGAANAPISRYRVSLAFAPAGTVKGPTGVRLLVTWPAAADGDPSKAPKNYANSLEVVTALDRN